MKVPQFHDGILVLPAWAFLGSDARVPHRSKTLALSKLGNTEFFVCSNHKGNLFWVHAVAPGFAGDRCRASLTCATRNKAKAELWRVAVQAGNVRITE